MKEDNNYDQIIAFILYFFELKAVYIFAEVFRIFSFATNRFTDQFSI